MGMSYKKSKRYVRGKSMRFHKTQVHRKNRQGARKHLGNWVDYPCSSKVAS